MQYKKIILYCCFCLGFSMQLMAQTHYSSQSFTGMNFFNPAYVGFGVNNKFQSFYRSQFEGVGDPYRTIGVGLDLGLFKTNKNLNKNIFGMGLQVVSEQVMGGLLQTNFVTLSLANRVFLNEKKSTFLALGISATLISRTIDASRLTFGDQYNSGRLFNASSLENIKSIPIKTSNNGGLMFTSLSEQSYFQMGASIFYINANSDQQVIEKFDQSYQYIGSLSYERALWNNNTILVYADYQKKSEYEFLYTGAAIGLPFYNQISGLNRLYFGGFLRSKDAIIPYFGLLTNRYKLGLTYDIYQKNRSLSNLRPQTFEFSFSTYLGRRRPEWFKSVFD